MNLDNPAVVPAPAVTEAQTVSGDMFPATIQAPEPQQDAVTPAPVVPPAAQRIVVGDKVFNTAEEAIAYADGLAQAQNNFTQKVSPTFETPQSAVQPKKPGTLIFEDPDQALADVENRAVERMRAEQRVVDENKKFWEDFRRTYPDLVGTELVVDAVLAREQSLGTLKGLTREQAAPILAAKARQEISKIKNVPSGGQALPSTPAVVAGASGASTPKPPIPQAQPTNFVSELQGLRKRG